VQHGHVAVVFSFFQNVLTEYFILLMNEAAIKIEHLSKKYLIQHQSGHQRSNYKALRDVLAEAAQSALKRLSRRSSHTNGSPGVEEFWALRDISLEIKRGDAVAIIGRNGAGKSTLLKILSRITSPTTGKIELNGRVASLLEVGTGFHPELTGRENIFLNGAIIGMTRAEIRRQFDAIVAFADVEKFLDTPVKRYSSGMYVRLAFAVAAHLDSEILIVDEVLAVGDAEFQKKCLGKMNEVHRSNRTVIFVSHNMAAIQQLCTTGVLLEKGSIVANDRIDKVVNQYLKGASRLESKVNLESAHRPWGKDDRIGLVSLEVNGGKPLLYGEPCEFMMTARSETTMPDLCFEISFWGLDGVRYVTFDSVVANFRGATDRGLLCVHLTIPHLPLEPALYFLTVGMHSGGTGLDYLQNVIQVEVFEGPATPAYRTGRLGAECALRLPGEWRISKS
jgi:lipopolysaccharide transport system ATP-binding protein